MADLLVRNLLRRVSATLMDTRPQFKRYTQADMVLALRAAVRAVCKYLPHSCARTVAVQLLPGHIQPVGRIPSARVQTYDGATPWDLDVQYVFEVVRNMGTNGLTPGRAIRLTDQQRQNAIDPFAHSIAGTVVRQYAYNPQVPTEVLVWPPVAASPAVVWVDMRVSAPPAPIPDGSGGAGSETYRFEGSSTQVVGLDDRFEDELWNYCCAYLLLSEAKAQGALNRAALHVQAFNASINSLAEQQTGHNPNLKALPFAPEVPGAAS